MHAHVSSFALALTAALCLNACEPSFAQTAALKAATPLAATAQTAVPALIPFVGAALTADGKPLSGESAITFMIYKDESGGEPLFTESQSLALDTTGHYKAQLGATLPSGIPTDLFTTGEARWLEVQIAGQPPQPRVLLVSVPYALKAGDASTLGGLPASAYALAASKSAAPALAASASSSADAVHPDAVSNVTTVGGNFGTFPLFTGGATIANSILYQNAAGTGIGVGVTPNPTSALDVNGKTIVRGIFNLARTANATPAAGANSYPSSFNAMAYNSAQGINLSPVFYWQAEATGNNTANTGATMNLLYNPNSGTGTETGLYFNPNGLIHFAPGQTFPGASALTGVSSGFGLTGGGTSGNVTLGLDTARVPLLASNNTFTGSQYVFGSLTSASAISASGTLSTSSQLVSTVANGTAPLSVNSATQVPNLNASLLGGLPPSAFITTTAGNTFTGTQTFTRVGIGTTTPRSQLELSSTAPAALGSVITLTNTAGTSGAKNAIDFNSVAPLTTGTYNPMARIAAVDALQYSDDIVFQTNIPGERNNGLQTNMVITSTGLVGIRTTTPTATLQVNGDIAAGSASFSGPVTFAPGQTFPGIGPGTITAVTAGTALTGGGSSGAVILNLDTTKVPLLAANNTFAGNLTTQGIISAPIVNATSAYDLGGVSFASGSASTENVYIGFYPNSQNAGMYNTSLGVSALGSNRSDDNTASGFQALILNVNGSGNTADGVAALSQNNGDNNTASGRAALYSNTTGSHNTASGDGALYHSTTGVYNTASGDGALPYNMAGSYNVGIGSDAGTTIDASPGTGSYNTAIGSGTTFTSGSISNATAIGANSVVAESNTMVLGSGVSVGIGTSTPDNLLTVNGSADKPGGGSWGTYSDIRLKTVNGSFGSGLDQVMHLRPIRYRYRPDNALGIRDMDEHIGVVAQEVQRVIPEAVTQNAKGYLLVNNDPVIWSMVNAIQEQQRMLKQQQKLLRAQTSMLRTLQAQVRETRETLRQAKAQLTATQPTLLAQR